MTIQESVGITTTANRIAWPCGFWRRLGAALVDSLVLGAVGVSLGFVWGDAFARLGQSGRWLGFVIAGAYFIVLQARTGQSLGKMALALKVVRLDGTPIDARQSAVRYVALGLPWILNGMYFEGSGMPEFVLVAAGILLGVVVFSGLVGNLYLLAFNLPSRRLLHDWIAGTVVVRAGALPCLLGASQVNLRRVHLGMVAGLVMAVFGVILFIGLALGTGFKAFEPLMATQRQINALPGVQSAQVTENWSNSSKQGREHTLNIIVRLVPGAHEQRRTIALSAVARAMEVWKVGKIDAIGVQVAEGYDIGIASKWWGEGERHTAAEWLEVLRGAGVKTGDVKT